MIKALKTYIAIFGFIGQSSNKISINGTEYIIPDNKIKVVNWISFLFILFPGITLVITNVISNQFDLSLFAVILIHLIVYLVLCIVFGALAGIYIKK